MIYYVKENSVYSSEILLNDKDFLKITEEEYLIRLNKAVLNREEGVCVADEEEM